MTQITTLGVALAKEVMVVCAADQAGRTVYFRQFSFKGFAEWAIRLSPCHFGLEACSSAPGIGCEAAIISNGPR
jgi:transposase